MICSVDTYHLQGDADTFLNYQIPETCFADTCHSQGKKYSPDNGIADNQSVHILVLKGVDDFMKDQYSDPVTYQRGNYMVRVYHPILTEEERARRQQRLERATARFMKEALEKEREKKRKLS